MLLRAHRGHYIFSINEPAGEAVIVKTPNCWICNCAAFLNSREDCGHIKACRAFLLNRKVESGEPESFAQATIETGRPVPVPQPKQNWPAYNEAQTQEKLMFLDLLSQLAELIPEVPNKGAGRPPMPLREMVFASVCKTYEMLSSRRLNSDLEIAKGRGYLSRVPHFNTLLGYLNKEELTPVLTALIQISALPLRDFESTFAVDASGLSSAFYSRWLDYRFNGDKRVKDWLKVHLICGTKTNIVTHVVVTDGSRNDCPQFPVLVKETAKNFKIREVCADMGYSSRANMQLAWDFGATPYIPFKENAAPNKLGSKAWAKMFYYFKLNQERFYSHYHQRSNVETTFSMLKRKFNGRLMLKNEAGQVNEALAKVLCHNVVVLIHEIHELGIAADFKEFAHLFPRLHINRDGVVESV